MASSISRPAPTMIRSTSAFTSPGAVKFVYASCFLKLFCHANGILIHQDDTTIQIKHSRNRTEKCKNLANFLEKRASRQIACPDAPHFPFSVHLRCGLDPRSHRNGLCFRDGQLPITALHLNLVSDSKPKLPEPFSLHHDGRDRLLLAPETRIPEPHQLPGNNSRRLRCSSP